jgi:hypothetical protein
MSLINGLTGRRGKHRDEEKKHCRVENTGMKKKNTAE